MLDLDFDVAVVTAQDPDTWCGVQIKGFTAPGEALGWMDLQLPFGFASWPLDATIGDDGRVTGCFTFVANRGNRRNNGGFAWLGHDPRMGDKCPPRVQGSSCQWNAKGAFNQLNYVTDTATVYVPVAFDGNGTPTKAHSFVVGKDANGANYTELRHANGAYITQTSASTVIRHDGNALVEVKGDEIVLNGAVNLTASLSVGGAAAQGVVNATLLAATLLEIAAPLASGAPAAAPVLGGALAGFLVKIAAALAGPTATAATTSFKAI